MVFSSAGLVLLLKKSPYASPVVTDLLSGTAPIDTGAAVLLLGNLEGAGAFPDEFDILVDVRQQTPPRLLTFFKDPPFYHILNKIFQLY